MPKKKKRSQGRKGMRRSARRGKVTTIEALELKAETRRHISGFVQIALSAVFFLVIERRAGIAGEALDEFITFFFGGASILLPLAFFISGIFLVFRKDGAHLEFRNSVGLGLCLLAILGLIHIQAPFEEIGARRAELGGAIGFMVSFPLLAFSSVPVAYVILSALLIVGLLIAFEAHPVDILRLLSRGVRTSKGQEQSSSKIPGGERVGDLIEEGMQRGKEEVRKVRKVGKELEIVRPAFVMEKMEKGVKPQKPKVERPELRKKDEDIEMEDTRFEDWEFPSLECLDSARSKVMVDDKTLETQARLIEEKLKEFEIEVKVREAHPGPTVTQFALDPSEGVKLSRIANLKSDLALALAAPSLRIEAPIPGKALVGIEMPNTKRTTVHLREMLESPEFRATESSLALPFGRDVSGRAVVEDLAEMPHLLIAGATGSGKSVCMNTFLMSLLFQNAPHELKIILIDPKRVELTMYDGIPHLLTPVITESEKALRALRWVVAEMGRRLAKFSEAGARNLQEFNDKHEDAKHIPRIVVIIDELADLMMRQYRRDTELMITRIAQIARATGIHLVIATQRPSVDVITGIIKANIPSRIAFRTVSSVDSRTILDCIGSEDLLGKGDMLHMNAGTPMPVRVQGVMVSTKEVERVINQVKIAGGGRLTAQISVDTGAASAEQRMDDDTMQSDSAGVRVWEGTDGSAQVIPSGHSGGIDLDADDDGGDDLTFEAIELVRSTGKASASLLQRHLKVGYARAARILDILEEKGVIGPGEGAKARKVYVE